MAVLCGGSSAEAEVSRASGRCVAEALGSTYANVSLLELDASVAELLGEAGAEVVFPILHGPPGEDGTLQGFLEVLRLPYVGSGVRASAIAIDKVVSKHVFRAHGLPVARDLVVDRSEGSACAVRRARDHLGERLVVKPVSQGSAVGVTLLSPGADFEGAFEEAFSFEAQVLVEERIEGREITAGVLERDGLEVFPLVEVRTPGDSWYDYEHRYTDGLSEHLIPAPLPEEQYRRVEQISRDAHTVLGCRDWSRPDFIVPASGEPILLEVNTLPGMTPTSLYPDAARSGGLPFEDLVAYLVERALTRAP